MIQLYHVYKYYHQVPALLDINLRIFKGDLAFVTGASRAGKSTLLKLLYLAERCSRGKIVLAGRELEQLGSVQTAQLRRSIGVVFQDFKLIPYKTVFENVAIALEVVGASGTLIERKVGELLRALGLFHKRSTLPPALAGGEQQRVAIARALVNDPAILLADEPTGNLDHGLSTDIFQLFRDANNRGTTVVVATHDETLMEHHGTANIHLDKGRIARC